MKTAQKQHETGMETAHGISTRPAPTKPEHPNTWAEKPGVRAYTLCM